MTKLSQSDVLQALAEVEVSGGLRPLAAGLIQDVVIEWHDLEATVAIHVDAVWGNGPPSSDAVEALARPVRQLPAVVEVRVVARSRERAAQTHQFVRPGAGGKEVAMPDTEVVAVLSGKGGVGKSTVAINLAVALADSGRRTALLDCDIYGYGVPDLLGVRAPLTSESGQLVPPLRHGVAVMSMDFFVKPGQVVMWRGPMLGKAFRQMLTQTAWPAPEFLILDMPPGTGDMALDVHESLPRAQALVVTTPDLRAARVAERAGRMAMTTGHRLLGVVETMSHLDCEGCERRTYPLGRGGGDQVASALGTWVMARIPWAFVDGEALDVVAPRGSPAQAAYGQLAQAVLAGLGAPDQTQMDSGGGSV